MTGNAVDRAGLELVDHDQRHRDLLGRRRWRPAAAVSWVVQYWTGTAWANVSSQSGEPTAINTFNQVTFDPVTTTKLRISLVGTGTASVGAIQWVVPSVLARKAQHDDLTVRAARTWAARTVKTAASSAPGPLLGHPRMIIGRAVTGLDVRLSCTDRVTQAQRRARTLRKLHDPPPSPAGDPRSDGARSRAADPQAAVRATRPSPGGPRERPFRGRGDSDSPDPLPGTWLGYPPRALVSSRSASAT